MKKLLLLALALVSLTNVSAANTTEKSVNFYQDISCYEMTNLDSDDEFIRFAAREIVQDLGKDVCSRVQSMHSAEFDEHVDEGLISFVQYGKLIESIHTLYTSEL